MDPKKIQETTKPIIDTARKMMTKEDGIDPDDDKFLKTVENITKYVPMVVGLIQGFSQQMQAARAANQPQQMEQPQQRGPEPPPGWLSMDPLQKLSKKYVGGQLNPWYVAGLRYDAWADGTASTDVPAAQGYPPQHTQADWVTPTRENIVRQQRGEPTMNPDYGLPPPDFSTPVPAKSAPSTPAPSQAQGTPGVPAHGSYASVAPTQAPPPQRNELPPEVQAAIAVNTQYIKLATGYINSMSDEDLERWVNDPKTLREKAKAALPLLPPSVVSMLREGDLEAFVQTLKEECTSKWVVLEQKQLVEQARLCLRALKEAVA